MIKTTFKVGMLAMLLVAAMVAQTGTKIAGSRSVVGGTWDVTTAGKTKIVKVVIADSAGTCTDENAWEWNPTTKRLFACAGGNWTKMADAAALGGGGGVTSFASRTGAVLVDAADYAAFYVGLAGSYSNPSWITAIAASKITGAIAAATSVQLAANGANCPAGQAPVGVDTFGAVEGCFTPAGGDTNLLVSKVSNTVIRVARGRHTVGDLTYSVAGHDCTITSGTASGAVEPWTARNGNVIIKMPTGIVSSCALTAGETLGAQDMIVETVTTVPANTFVRQLAASSVTSGALGTVVGFITPVGGMAVEGAGVISCTTTAGITTCSATADVARLSGSQSYLGAPDFRATTRSTPHRRGTGPPAAGECTAGNILSTYADDAVGGLLYFCRQETTGVYTWLPIGAAGGGGVTVSTGGQGSFVAAPYTGYQLANGQDTFPVTTSSPYYAQVTIPFSLTVRKVKLYVTGAVGASAGFAVALYNATCTTKLADATSIIVPPGSSAAFTLNIPSAPTLSGVVTLGWASESSGLTMFQLVTGHPALLTTLNDDAVTPTTDTTKLRLFRGSTVTTGTGTGLTMPAACGARTANSQYVPMFVLMP